VSIKAIKGREFFGPILRSAALSRNPMSVMFELTYRCNFRCPHCYVEGSPKDERELTTQEVFLIIDQLRDMGVLNIAFTGGEALLRKDIFDILAYAKRRGFQTALLTNGSLINKNIADKLLRVHVNKVDITLNSLKPEVSQKLTGVKNALNKVKRAIGLLIKRGINVKLKSTGMSINRDELASIGKLARSLNVVYNLDCEILPSRNGCGAAVGDYSLSLDEAQALRRAVYPEMFRQDGRKPVRPRRRRKQMFNCGVGRNSFSITPYGKMIFCLEIDYPGHDILKLGAKECWEKIKREVDRLNNAKDFVCKSCELINSCSWCAGRSYMETGELNKCSEYFKNRAIGANNAKKRIR
jgi:radical SAM protein with 4Fe4S-binding SPASM domain